MSVPGKDFRDRLLEAERLNPTYQEKYRKELRAMLEQRLTVGQRWAWIGSAVLAAGLAVVFGAAAVLAPSEFPMLPRIGFIVGVIFNLAWSVLAIKTVKKGTLNLKTHPTRMVGMAWGFVVIMITLFMLLAPQLPQPVQGVQMVLNGLVFLLMGAAFMISNRVDQAELKTRQKLLEIEYRLAELAEAMGNKQQG